MPGPPRRRGGPATGPGAGVLLSGENAIPWR